MHERSENNVDDEILMKGLFNGLFMALICYTEFSVEIRLRMKIRDYYFLKPFYQD